MKILVFLKMLTAKQLIIAGAVVTVAAVSVATGVAVKNNDISEEPSSVIQTTVESITEESTTDITETTAEESTTEVETESKTETTTKKSTKETTTKKSTKEDSNNTTNVIHINGSGVNSGEEYVPPQYVEIYFDYVGEGMDLSNMTYSDADIGKTIGKNHETGEVFTVQSVEHTCNWYGDPMMIVYFTSGNELRLFQCTHCGNYPCPDGGEKRCSNYSEKTDPDIYCQDCGELTSKHNNYIFEDVYCYNCGEFAEAWKCHICAETCVNCGRKVTDKHYTGDTYFTSPDDTCGICGGGRDKYGCHYCP